MLWIQRRLRGNRVYVRADAEGRPEADRDGRVDVVYALTEGAKLYRASLRNLEPDPDSENGGAPIQAAGVGRPAQKSPPASGGNGASAGGGRQPPADAIVVYTDGACHGNPGPMGVGVVIIDAGKRREISDYLGVGTNNIAELTAIESALKAIPADQRKRPIWIHTDSNYSIGVLSKSWKAKANQELIERIKILQRQFPDLVYVKVKGHAGVPENERCDELANDAIART